MSVILHLNNCLSFKQAEIVFDMEEAMKEIALKKKEKKRVVS